MFKSILQPGINFVGRLNLSKKFFLIFVLYLFPVGYVAYYAMSKHMTAINATENEVQHLKLLKKFKPVFINMAKSRGLTNAYLNGNESAKPQIDKFRSIVDSQFQSIQTDKAFNKLGGNITSRFRDVASKWETLKVNAFNLQAEESFAQHSNLIAEILGVLSAIKEQSNLMTDPQPETAFLIKSFVEELPKLAETTGKTRGMGAGIAAKGSFTSDSFIALSNYHAQLSNIIDSINHSMNGAMSLSGKMKSISPHFSQFNDTANGFLKLTKDSMLDPDKIQVDSSAYFAEGTKVIESALALYEKTYETIQSSLVERKEAIYGEIWLNLLSSIGLIIAALYLFASFSSSLLDSINRIKDCVNEVAHGDLTVKADVQSSDEMSKIGQDVNQMISNTKSLVTKVFAATNDLVGTAETNNASAEMTNQKINQQNVEVEQVATAMNEMSATVQEVANNAEESAASTGNADKLSKEGFDTVQKTINSISSLANELEGASQFIGELQENAQGIGSVLDVIQGIADQTNLLALNAAIEAARAGESGRGFAVVADEVRTLASKTQESTEEIRQMIDKLQSSANKSVSSMSKGVEMSQESVEDAQSAGQALNQITDSVGHISAMGEQIASAATQQSSVAEEINRSVLSVKNISQDTMNAANDAARNSLFLREVATNLQQLVSQFKV